MAVTTSTIGSAFLAAEVLVAMVGQEAAQQSNMPKDMWVEYLIGDESLNAHFRFVNPMTVGAATEGAALPTGSWSPTGVVISAGLDGQAVQTSKLLANSLSPRVLSDIATASGNALGRAIDTSAVALFPSLTGGTVGTSGAALTVSNILTANANLDANHADEIGTYKGRLHPHAYLNLQNDVMSKNWGIAKLDTQFGRTVIDIDGTIIERNTLVPSINTNADWAGGIFVYQALGLAIAQEPTVEILSIPGSAAYSIDSYVAFGVGVIRPTLGCLVQSGKAA